MDALHGAFVVVPWWVGPPMVLLAFAVFRWGVPAVVDGDTGLLQIDVLSYRLAPVFAGLVALCWVLALVVKRFGAAYPRP